MVGFKPGFIQIPKIYSSPVDPKAPSFLTNLPVEIRILVYEVLFRHKEPVLVHNANAHHTKPPVKPGAHISPPVGPREWLALLLYYDQIYDAEIGSDHEFVNDFHHGLQLLLSCRQVYHESAWILYGTNRFIITRGLIGHDTKEIGLYEGYSPLAYAQQWISDLGSQASFLRHVTIDVDAICPANCIGSSSGFDILPLLRFIWRFPNGQCTLRFGHTGRTLLAHEGDVVSENTSADMADLLNNILHALAIRDVLNIKWFAQSVRFVKALGVYPRRNSGMLFWHDKRNHPEIEPITITDSGHMIHINTKDQSDNMLMRLPPHLIRRIFGVNSYSSEGILLDLDTRSTCSLRWNLIQLDKSTRKMVLFRPDILTRSNKITIRATSEKLTTNFNNFAALKELLPYPHSTFPQQGRVSHASILSAILKRGLCVNSLEISMNINHSMPATLDEVLINIKGLIPILRRPYIYGHNNVTARITLTYPDESGTHEEVSTFSLSDLRKRLFLLFSDIILNWTWRIPKVHSRECPTIWIDGHGKIVAAWYALGPSRPECAFGYRHNGLREDEIEQRALGLAAKVCRMGDSSFVGLNVRDELNYEALVEVWHDLQFVEREDCRMREPWV